MMKYNNDLTICSLVLCVCMCACGREGGVGGLSNYKKSKVRIIFSQNKVYLSSNTLYFIIDVCTDDHK